MKDVIVIGAGGHAKVIADIVIRSNDNLIGFLDDRIEVGTKILGDYEVMGPTNLIESIKGENKFFIIAIGDNLIRKTFYEKYNINYYTAIHPTAIIGTDVELGEGTCVMPNACINANTKIGKCCIINSGALVEHDCVIDDFVHISPTATVCGTVKIGKLTQIGARASVRNNVTIGEEILIGMGATVVKDIIEKGTYIGTPAKLKED